MKMLLAAKKRINESTPSNPDLYSLLQDEIKSASHKKINKFGPSYGPDLHRKHKHNRLKTV